MTNKNDLIKCHDRIKPFIHNTPVLTSISINKMIGANLFFKCDNFQKMGAFKMRGAANAILQLSEDQKKKRGSYSFVRKFCASTFSCCK